MLFDILLAFGIIFGAPIILISLLKGWSIASMEGEGGIFALGIIAIIFIFFNPL